MRSGSVVTSGGLVYLQHCTWIEVFGPFLTSLLSLREIGKLGLEGRKRERERDHLSSVFNVIES